MNDYQVEEVIGRTIRRYLMWYRHYWGQVINTQDRLQLGRIQVAIPELRWTDQTNARWCMPRYNPGISVPKQGAVVEVYFVEGNPTRPVWLGRVPEQNEKVQSYTGPTTHVLFEDETTGDYVLYDEQAKSIQFLGKAESLVIYGPLATVFSNLVTWLNGHTHSVTSAPGTTGVPSVSVSIDPSAAKAAHLLTQQGG